jgi:uncharacterized protein DUF3465
MNQFPVQNVGSGLSSRVVVRLIMLAVLLAVAYLAGIRGETELGQPASVPATRGTAGKTDSDRTLEAAFEQHRRNVEVQGVGRVVRILADDREGIEHQKFILQLASGQELLVAHNTDLAGRVEGLRKGDTVEFRGEYEWNPQGGVLHWTHRDPGGRHPDGWLKHDGRDYQ